MRKVLFSAVKASMAYSSLGYGAVWSAMQPCDHGWLADGPDGQPVPHIVEGGASLWSYDVILISAGWELEVPRLVRALQASGIDPFAESRPAGQPLIVGGGPLTLSNPDLLAAVCDAVFVGEADDVFAAVNDALLSAGGRRDALDRLGAIPGMWVPSSGAVLPAAVTVKLHATPLFTAFPGRENEFSNAFIVEVGRGCPRGCDFCVAFGGRKGRFYDAAAILDAVPVGTARAGLLGAAVSDHPDLKTIVSALLERGTGVTLGSVRADRVDDELIRMLASGGLRTLTIAADGASDALRRSIHKGICQQDLMNAVEVAAKNGIDRVRVYVMLGLPGETQDDLAEFATLVRAMSERVKPVVSVSPFVPKRFTRLQDAPFAGVGPLRRRINDLRRLVGPRVEVRAGSVKHAEIEYRLSRVGLADARAMLTSLAADHLE